MRRRYPKKGNGRAKNPEFSNFLPLIVTIRADLGPDWVFYQEFLEGVVEASNRGATAAAWYEQIKPLVASKESLYFAHEGVCFLLRGLEARALEARSANMGPPPLPPQLSFRKSISQARNLSPTEHADTQSAALPRPDQPPKLVLPKHHRSVSDVPAPGSQDANINPIFFTDAVFEDDVTDYMHTPTTTPRPPPRMHRNTTPARDDSHLAPPYYAEDNDVAVWRKCKQRGSEAGAVLVLQDGPESPSPSPQPEQYRQHIFPPELQPF